jgi:hypothetical protein
MGTYLTAGWEKVTVRGGIVNTVINRMEDYLIQYVEDKMEGRSRVEQIDLWDDLGFVEHYAGDIEVNISQLQGYVFSMLAQVCSVRDLCDVLHQSIDWDKLEFELKGMFNNYRERWAEERKEEYGDDE